MRILIRHLVIFALLFISFNYIFAFFYEKPDRQAIINKTHDKYLKWNDLHSNKNTYDIIFLGSSIGYCAYNPIIFDSILNKYSYNMCTGSQNIIETYYVLKDILLFQKPNIIVYEIYLPSFDNNTDYYHVISNGNFMSIKNELDMIINGFGMEGIANYIFPILKNKFYIKNDLLNLFGLVKSENNPDIKKNKWIHGYLSDSTTIDTTIIRNYPHLYNFTNTQVSENKIYYYFDALIQLCKINDIKLVCTIAPYPPSRIENSDTDTVSQYFNKVCKNNRIPFYDLNYLTNNKFKYKDTDFMDFQHMNYQGANKVSRQLAELLFSMPMQ